ncbi:uncharacterized protein LOC143026895 [Oratosquilla oratoria]|uniref:uncharacterized protein LOC143026895 n=1 Tax=Oratosquilla oratoria TaxID=337810 RepID=UPI003F775383
MSRYKVYDKDSAIELMKKFSDLAYNTSCLTQIETAIQILYGKEFRVITDMAKRMQFQCKICNQEMNSHGAVADHFRSGKHQKNLDKLRLDSPAPSSSSKYNDYSPTSIQYKFLKNGRAVGLQFLEEFWKGSRRVYYRCILCGAHGKIDAMYNHMVGARHVEKYIKTTCSLKYPALTANEREGIRKKIIDEEGINVNAIAIYDDPALYPSKWEAEGAAARTRQGRSIKEEIKEEIQKSEPSGSSSDNEPEEPCKLETKTQATQTGMIMV